MTQTKQLVYAGAVAIAGIWILLGLAALAGVRLGTALTLFIIAGWLIICLSGYRWLSPLHLLTYRLRKPILEEEEWLHPLVHSLNLRSNITPWPRLFILEDPMPNAFAIARDVVVLSRGLIVHLNEREIEAVLAHEYGHLRDKDTQSGATFMLAMMPLSKLYRYLYIISQVLVRRRRWKLLLFFIVLLGIGLVAGVQLATFLLGLVIFVMAYPLLSKALVLGWSYFSRQCEFRQDAFAQALGFGRPLKTALLKIEAMTGGQRSNGFDEFWHSHPLMYRRIRRIEWLEGLRPTP